MVCRAIAGEGASISTAPFHILDLWAFAGSIARHAAVTDFEDETKRTVGCRERRHGQVLSVPVLMGTF